MHISHVKINNFRNFRDFDTNLGSNVVLLGENGVGKTNFFEALRLALDSSHRPLLGSSDFNNRLDLPKFRGTEIRVEVEFTDFMNDQDQDFLSNCINCLVRDDPPTAKITFLYRPKDVPDDELHSATGPDYYESIWYGGDDVNNLQGARYFRKRVKFRIVPALRDIDNDMRVWQRSPLRRLTETMNLSGNPNFQSVANKVKSATEDLQKIDPVKKLQDEIKSRLTEMIEGLHNFDPKIGLLPTNPDELQKTLTLLFEDNYSLDKASLGLANVLYLSLLTLEIELQRKSTSADDYAYTILAIEEPESHLHPHLQRLVFSDFLRIDTPVLLSTHSPNIVSVADPDWFLLLKKHDGGTQKETTANLVNLPSWDSLKQDLSRYLDVNRGESVFSKGVILVEGDTENFLFPAFAKKMKEAGLINYTLDGAGISIINVSGTDFLPYVQFFGPNGLNLPLAMITDGDKYAGLKRIANRLINNSEIPDEKISELQSALENGSDSLRECLDNLNYGHYEGLDRGTKIAEILAPTFSDEINDIYQKGEWGNVRDKLCEIGIFVNDWTLEAELVNTQCGEEMLLAYRELDASETQVNNMKAEIQAKNVEKIIRRIETSGKGKGRFAQRLANHVNANKIPEYIQQAIRYVVL